MRGRGKVRVLVVGPSLSGGGAERFASNLLCGLDSERFEPHVCIMGGDVSYPLPAGVAPVSLEKSRPWHIPRSIRSLAKLIEDLRPHVVLGTMLYTDWVVASAVALLGRSKPRLIARFAMSPNREYEWRGPYSVLGPLLRLGVRLLVRRADCWVANSRGLAADVGLFGRDRDRVVHVLPNPFDFEVIDALARETALPTSPPSWPKLLAVGRLADQKRFDVALEALAILLRDQPHATLWICGDGPLRGALQALAVRLGLADSVVFLGSLENPFPVYREADVFVLSSDYEGLPNALIEAQGLGLPAVASRCPFGPEEIVKDGETGSLVPVGNPAALAAGISAVLADHERMQDMSVAAKARARRLFGKEPVMEAWQALLMEEASRSCVE